MNLSNCNIIKSVDKDYLVLINPDCTVCVNYMLHVKQYPDCYKIRGRRQCITCVFNYTSVFINSIKQIYRKIKS